MTPFSPHSPFDAYGTRTPRRTPYRPLLWVAAATGAGAAVDYCWAGDARFNLLGWWWGLAALATALAWVARQLRREILAASFTLIASAGLGGAWEHWRWNYFPGDDLGRFAVEAAQPACVDVVLAERVKISPPGERSPLRAIPARTMSEATVRIEAIRDGATWRRAGGQTRLRVAGELRDVAPGDRLRVFAQRGEQPPALNPGQYDWAAAERRNGRLCELYCDDPQCVVIREPAPRFSIMRLLHGVRLWCSAQLASSVGPRAAPLVLATLLGDQERLSDATKDAFLQTGSIHLLVISGAHVAMLAGIVWGVARAAGLSSRWQLALTLVAVLAYAAVVGHEPSVTRATILAVATLLALEAGRKASAGNLLGAAALVVMALNPNELFRSGTQFSFLVVAALVIAGRWLTRSRPVDPLRRLIADTRPWTVRVARRGVRAIAMALAVSVAVGAVVAPLVAYHFHGISIQPAGSCRPVNS